MDPSQAESRKQENQPKRNDSDKGLERPEPSGEQSRSQKHKNSGGRKPKLKEWTLDTPPPAGYEIAVDRGGSGESSGKTLRYRRLERRCESCDGPLYEAYVDGTWYDTGPLCTRCLSRIESAKWLEEAIERVARLSALNQDARLDNFVADLPHQDTGLRAAQSFVDEIKKGHPLALVLYSYANGNYSGYGVGKTHLASAVAYEMQRRGWRVQTWLAPDLFAEIRASYADDAELQEYAILHPARSTDLLVVDDVGKENAREEWRKDIYFRIVDSRYRRGPIVITTNLDAADEFPAHIGEAAYSRLWEMSRTRWWVDMCGPDWRARIAKGD